MRSATNPGQPATVSCMATRQRQRQALLCAKQENKKKNIKDISRYRTKKYDAVMKTYKSLDLKCDSLHKQVLDSCSSKDNTDEFKRFIDLAKFKFEFMGRLSTFKDAEEWRRRCFQATCPCCTALLRLTLRLHSNY